VNMQYLKDLMGMGYEKWLVAEALKQSNNNLNDALTMLVDPSQRSILETTLKSARAEGLARRFPSFAPKGPLYQDQEMQLKGMGFGIDQIRFALRLNRGNVDKCIALLTQDTTVIDALMAANPEILRDLEEEFKSEQKLESTTTTASIMTENDSESSNSSNSSTTTTTTTTTPTTTTTVSSESSSSSSSSDSFSSDSSSSSSLSSSPTTSTTSTPSKNTTSPKKSDEEIAKEIEAQFYRAEMDRKHREEAEKKKNRKREEVSRRKRS